MTEDEARRRVETFLTSDVRDALRSVAYDLPPFDRPARAIDLAEAARAEVEIRHARGAPDALYLVQAFGDCLLLSLQLNVWRLVVIYRTPAADGVDVASLAPRLERWQRGAEHAGWLVGWREAVEPDDRSRRYVETYCYANAARGLLEDEVERMFWRADIVQMTRAFMLEAHRCGIRLSPRAAGYPV